MSYGIYYIEFKNQHLVGPCEIFNEIIQEYF